MQDSDFTDIPEAVLDRLALDADKQNVRRTRNLRLIPYLQDRRGGKLAAIEWGHVIGIFQTLIYTQLSSRGNANILDVGCGTGLLAIASEPFVSTGGQYLGVDVSQRDVEFCKSHYTESWFKFKHLDIHNPVYAEGQAPQHTPWDVEDNSQDLVMALSVWTHLDERDAKFYFQEVNRVLKPYGKAIITFFLLDAFYETRLRNRSVDEARYNMTKTSEWIFDQPAYESENWFCPTWAQPPERAIGVSETGLAQLMAPTSLQLYVKYPGNWKEMPGMFFQDILVFSKMPE